ncbi:MAG: Lipoprotein-releasing system ATP-binding protein LolD [Ignavibacteriaceae bacterium]|nr:Lipoprotein-releasing system ATP-binding protein LolD [Ignavibacteriaceae bacterium]
MSNTILSARNIVKSFSTDRKERLEILKDISLDIIEKKITVIVGPSGAGKSTLLHILGGLDKPDAGSVHILGQELSKLSNSQTDSLRNSSIGFIFQFHHLLPEFSAEENIMIPLLIKGISRGEAQRRSDELIELVNLSHRKKHRPSELSGGEQQRIAVARAIANDPPLIFADEPTGNLDSANSEVINNFFIRLRDDYGKTLVIVTHNKDLMAIADNTVSMQDGKISG